MHIPKDFLTEDKSLLHKLIFDNSFALVITQTEHGPFASHLPLLFHPHHGEHGTLVGHMAKANPQWQHFASPTDVLCVFQGSHSYISPSWYEKPSEHVPTWNYVAVHAYGKATPIEDKSKLLEIVRETCVVYEKSNSQPWDVASSSGLQEELVSYIVGFEIQISQLKGQIKLSQNRTETDRQRVIDALAEGNVHQQELAQMMKSVFAVKQTL